MEKQNKPTKKEIGLMLKEALDQFCEKEFAHYRIALTEPFRQVDDDKHECVMASNGHVLVCIRAKDAGVAVSMFKKQDEYKAYKVIPFVGFEDNLEARTVRREDLRQVIEQMKRHEDATKETVSADMGGIQLSMEAVSRFEVVMRICGADTACLTWHTDDMVMLQMYNDRRQDAVTVLHMGWKPDKAHVIAVPTIEGSDGDARIDWQKGISSWQDIKGDLARREEEERMARREVYLVLMVKRGYVPVYAKDADEARRLANGENWFEPEDDGDDEWMLGDEVPELCDVEDLDDCYEHVITRDGISDRDEIYEMDRLSEEWEEERNNAKE